MAYQMTSKNFAEVRKVAKRLEVKFASDNKLTDPSDRLRETLEKMENFIQICESSV